MSSRSCSASRSGASRCCGSCSATALTVRTLRRGMPFALTWWSLTFPVGHVRHRHHAAGDPHRLPAFKVAAAIAYVGLLGTWGLVAVRTARGSLRGNLFRPPAGRRADQGQEGSAAEFIGGHKIKSPVLPSGRGVRRQHGAIRCIDASAAPLHAVYEIVLQASRIAATPWPPAAQIEIRPRTGCRSPPSSRPVAWPAARRSARRSRRTDAPPPATNR